MGGSAAGGSTARRRVYLPASADALRLLAEGRPWPARVAFAVTPAVRAADPDGDDEELEFSAFLQAAAACLDAMGQAPGRRVVVSADVPAAATHPVPPAADDSGAVALDRPVEIAQVVAVHVDDAEGGRVVAEVVGGAPRSRLDDVALLWFAATELDLALAEVLGG